MTKATNDELDELEARGWRWSRQSTAGPHRICLGRVWLTEDGLYLSPDDDFYAGTISRADALSLARAILRRFGGSEP
jgi:hypothetical protein